jgi:hypothetical protein
MSLDTMLVVVLAAITYFAVKRVGALTKAIKRVEAVTVLQITQLHFLNDLLNLSEVNQAVVLPWLRSLVRSKPLIKPPSYVREPRDQEVGEEYDLFGHTSASPGCDLLAISGIRRRISGGPFGYIPVSVVYAAFADGTIIRTAIEGFGDPRPTYEPSRNGGDSWEKISQVQGNQYILLARA